MPRTSAKGQLRREITCGTITCAIISSSFYRQRAIENYIVDFYCSRARLVIELDGSQHFTKEGLAHDAIRTEIIQLHCPRVLRFTNADIKNNFEGVCALIDRTAQERLTALPL